MKTLTCNQLILLLDIRRNSEAQSNYGTFEVDINILLRNKLIKLAEKYKTIFKDGKMFSVIVQDTGFMLTQKGYNLYNKIELLTEEFI